MTHFGARGVAFLLVFAAVAAIPHPVRAHGSLNTQIARLSRAIVAQPKDAALYLRRGEMHRLAADWGAAARDYDRAARLAPGTADLHLCRAALALDTGDRRAAIREASAYLALHPDHTEALLLRSQALYVDGRVLDAVADLDRAIALRPDPTPDHYVQRAEWLAAAQRYEDALHGLEAGIARLGSIVSLELAAIDLEITLGRRAAARARLATVEQQSGPQTATRARIEALPDTDSTPAPSLMDDGRPATVPAGSTSQPAVSLTGTGRAHFIAATLTRGPYLQIGTPTSVIVRWRTDLPTNSRVRWGASAANLTMVNTDTSQVTEHQLTITGLTANTRTYYSIGSTTETLAGGDANHFVDTPPPVGAQQPVRVWILGDSGEIGLIQDQVRDAYLAWTGARGTDVWLMLGDNAYNSGTNTDYQFGLFNPYQTILRQLVLWPTRGNHDQVFAGANNDYYDFFTLPTAAQAGGIASGSEAYYSFDYGNIHFVCLDSEGSSRSKTGPMAIWLRADLAANDQDWTIAYWHHPPYTKGSHDSDDNSDSGGRMRDMRQNIVPILDSLGVDLALTGHSHSYERSYLMAGHYGLSSTLQTPMILDFGNGQPQTGGPYRKETLGPAFYEGTVHTVAGSSSHTSGGTLNHPVMYISRNLPGSFVVDVHGPTLRGRFLDNLGAVLDDFSMVKGGATDSQDVRVELRMDDPHPNPFVAATQFAYALPAAGNVRLTIHDAAGRRIATVEAGERIAGRHVVAWDGRDGEGRRLPAGVYFARLEFAGETRQGKVVLSR